jgi:hypothetical protein
MTKKATAPKKENVGDLIKETLGELLEKMLVQAEVSVTGDEENGYLVTIQSQ